MAINYVVFNYHQLFNEKEKKKSISSTYLSSAACGNNVDCCTGNGKIQRNVSNLMGQTCTEKSSHTPESLILALSWVQIIQWKTGLWLESLICSPACFLLGEDVIRADCVSVSGSFDSDQLAQFSFLAEGRQILGSASFPFPLDGRCPFLTLKTTSQRG